MDSRARLSRSSPQQKPASGVTIIVETFDVVMLTKDEEINISHALKSVIGWAQRVHVVDSGSTDRTKEIASAMGARVVEQPWLGYARQRNWALDNLPFESPWIFILDADEIIMPDLRASMDRLLARPVGDVPESAFLVNRYFLFLGERIRHCGYYPSYGFRMFKRGRARYEDRAVHEYMLVDGDTGYLEGHLEHNDRRGLEHYMAKHNRYSTLEAEETYRRMCGTQKDRVESQLFGAGPLLRRRWIKEHVYPRLPAKWLMRFGYMYLGQRGFLDGRVGLEFCLFMSAYELLISLKLKELQNQGEHAHGSRV